MIKEDYLIKIYKMKSCFLLLLIIFSTEIFSQDNNMKTIISTSKAPQPVGPYNQAVLKDGSLFISGQIAIELDTKMLYSGDIENETEIVMKNIGNILNEAGFTFEDVVKSSIFTIDMGKFAEINKVYGSFFNNLTAPARETIEVSGLPLGANVEISVIAIK